MPTTLVDRWPQIWQADLKRCFVADFEIHDPQSPDQVAIFVDVTTER